MSRNPFFFFISLPPNLLFAFSFFNPLLNKAGRSPTIPSLGTIKNNDPVRGLLGQRNSMFKFFSTCFRRETLDTPGGQLRFEDKFTYTTSNLIYVISCRKCSKLYIGETGRRLDDRFQEHIRSVGANIASQNPFFSRVLAPLPLPRLRLLRRLARILTSLLANISRPQDTV